MLVNSSCLAISLGPIADEARNVCVFRLNTHVVFEVQCTTSLLWIWNNGLKPRFSFQGVQPYECCILEADRESDGGMGYIDHPVAATCNVLISSSSEGSNPLVGHLIGFHSIFAST